MANRVTPDTFQAEHFDKLLRGLSVAKEAYTALEAQLGAQENDREQALQRKLADAQATAEQLEREWELTASFIRDVERGIYSLGELVAFVDRLEEHGIDGTATEGTTT